MKIYQKIALQFFNVFIFLLVFNLLLAFIFFIRDTFFAHNPIYFIYGKEIVSRAYPRYSEKELDKLLQETWGRAYQYHPFASFQEKNFKGKYVNVHPTGFRYGIRQGKFPLDSTCLNIFIFGGSSAFGYGVSDNETISSYLQMEFEKKHPEKKLKCYNFGTGFYYSSQERALFESLLEAEHQPDIVIFIDGLNEFFFEKPFKTEEVKKLYAKENNSLLVNLIAKFPMMRLAKGLRLYFWATKEQEFMQRKNEKIPFFIKRYLRNKQMIQSLAKSFQTKAFFVWQPISCYQYDLKYHLFNSEKESDCFPAEGYQQMEERLNDLQKDSGFIWLADMQKDKKENLYVDAVHYSAKMNKNIAEELYRRISRQINLSGFQNPTGLK